MQQSIGRRGGAQFVSCKIGGPEFGVDSVMHEIGHAVGLFHEHQRPDRDAFVDVARTALEDVNFRIENAGSIMTTYDCNSIMHYGVGGPLTTKPGQCPGGVGQRNGLSILDQFTVNGLELDHSPFNQMLAVSLAGTLTRLQSDGAVFQYSGTLEEPEKWELIDANRANKSIIAGQNELYLLHHDGSVFRYQGTPFNWELIGRFNTKQLATDGDQLFLLADPPNAFEPGAVFRYLGDPFFWELLKINLQTTKQIACGGGQLYLLEEPIITNDVFGSRIFGGGVFRYTGIPQFWEQIRDPGLNTKQLAVVQSGTSAAQLYLLEHPVIAAVPPFGAPMPVGGGVFHYLGSPNNWESIRFAGFNDRELVAGGLDQLYLIEDTIPNAGIPLRGGISRYLGSPNLWQLINGYETATSAVAGLDRLYLIIPFAAGLFSIVMIVYNKPPILVGVPV